MVKLCNRMCFTHSSRHQLERPASRQVKKICMLNCRFDCGKWKWYLWKWHVYEERRQLWLKIRNLKINPNCNRSRERAMNLLFNSSLLQLLKIHIILWLDKRSIHQFVMSNSLIIIKYCKYQHQTFAMNASKVNICSALTTLPLSAHGTPFYGNFWFVNLTPLEKRREHDDRREESFHSSTLLPFAVFIHSRCTIVCSSQ